jgi:tetratricopeptide (TPR) repeat protein
MKAEKRHELETNYLAAWLGQMLKKTQPYHNAITWVLVAVVVLLGILVVWSKFMHRGAASAWDDFHSAMAADNLVELERIAEKHPGTPVAHWGLIVSADARLADACKQVFADKASAAQDLRKAVEAYTTVVDQSREPRLRQRALFGRARAYETLSGTPQGTGELPKAIADYERLVDSYPEGTYTAIASEQLKRLKSQDIKLFYDKFAALAPKQPSSKESEPGARQLPFDSSSLPGDSSQSEFSNLLNLSDLKVKGSKSSTTPGKSEPAKTEPGKTEPAKSGAAKPEVKTPVPTPVPPKGEGGKTEAPKAGQTKGVPPAPATSPPAPPPKSEPAKK